MSCEPTKILLKCACGQENVVQLGDMSRGFGRHADGQKVIVVNLRYISAQNTGILSYKTDKWFPLCDVIHKFRSSRPEVLHNTPFLFYKNYTNQTSASDSQEKHQK